MTHIYPTGRSAQDVYEALYTETTYGRHGRGEFFHGKPVLHHAKDCASFLNVGCGVPNYRLHLPKDINYACCDISPTAVQHQLEMGNACVWADLTLGLPWQNVKYEALGCFDVLEHIQPDAVDFALSELRRVATKVLLLHIAYAPARWHGPDRELLHLTVQPAEWWSERIKANCGGEVIYEHEHFVVKL